MLMSHTKVYQVTVATLNSGNTKVYQATLKCFSMDGDMVFQDKFDDANTLEELKDRFATQLGVPNPMTCTQTCINGPRKCSIR